MTDAGPVEAELRAMARALKPRVVDGAMALAGLATIVLWGSGALSARTFLIIVLTWMGLWGWRFATPGPRVWGPVAALLTVVLTLWVDVHINERTARGCTTELAERALAEQPVVSIADARQQAAYGGTDSTPPRDGGRCGLLGWRHAAVIDINELDRKLTDDEDLPVSPAVVLFDAGPIQFHVFHHTVNGYIYSPERRPEDCYDVVGGSSANNGYVDCHVDAIGGDWYWFIAENSAD